jgi:hypothetical protein
MPTFGKPVSLLASIPQELPHPGYTIGQDVIVDDREIFVDLFLVPPPPDTIWPQVVSDVSHEIILKDLKAGPYTIAATWHSRWRLGDVTTATASFTVVPEPNTLALIFSALFGAIAIVGRHAAIRRSTILGSAVGKSVPSESPKLNSSTRIAPPCNPSLTANRDGSARPAPAYIVSHPRKSGPVRCARRLSVRALGMLVALIGVATSYKSSFGSSILHLPDALQNFPKESPNNSAVFLRITLGGQDIVFDRFPLALSNQEQPDRRGLGQHALPPTWSGEYWEQWSWDGPTVVRSQPDRVSFNLVDVGGTGQADIWQLEFAAGYADRQESSLTLGQYSSFGGGMCTMNYPGSFCSPLMIVHRNGTSPVAEPSGTFYRLEQPGSFNILEASYGPNGEVISFAADFEQFDWTGARALYGQIRHNSTIPIPEPATIFLAAVGLCAMATGRSQQLLRRNQSLNSGNRRPTSASNLRIPRIPRCACRMVLRFLYSVSLN